MKQFRHLLVAVDMNDRADALADTGAAAVREAFALARRHGASVTLLHVIDAPGVRKPPAEPDIRTALGRHHAAALKTLKSLTEGTDTPACETRVRFGKHWREILEESSAGGHDLVVIGTRKRGLAGRLLFGSTGNKLLRLCPCPVWVVREQPKPERPCVLVAHDLTPVGEAALSIAAALNDHFDGADVKVLHVVEHPESDHFLESVAPDERKQRLTRARETIQSQCRALFTERDCEVHVTDGNAYARILEYLDLHPVDLLVMGTVARGGIKGLLTGNTAENVLPWANCSLIAIKPSGFAPPPAEP
jgi:nucleotide-binding universal stress UspA family protein